MNDPETTTTMKTALLVSIILLTGVAFEETAAGVLSNQPQILRITARPMHAEMTPLASEHSLVGGGRPRTLTRNESVPCGSLVRHLLPNVPWVMSLASTAKPGKQQKGRTQSQIVRIVVRTSFS